MKRKREEEEKQKERERRKERRRVERGESGGRVGSRQRGGSVLHVFSFPSVYFLNDFVVNDCVT